MKRLLALAFTVLLAVCCGKADAGYATQAESIKRYVDAQLESHPDYTAEWSGDIARLTVTQGEGASLAEGGLVKLFYAGYVFVNGVSSGSLFATNHPDIARAAGWNLSGGELGEGTVLDLSDKNVLEGLRKGLKGVKPGEECYVMFPSRYGMGDRVAGTIPAGSPLIYRIWVIDIEND